MRNGFSPEQIRYALSLVDNGFVFEDFAKSFLAAINGESFNPVGGLKDRGIDSLQHTFNPSFSSRSIYQMSIERNTEAKIERTLATLKKNKIKFDRLYYVTNQQPKKQDSIVDRLHEKYGISVYIHDIDWITCRVNTSEATARSFQTYVDSYLHDFTKPGKSYVVGDLIKDPRLFVFLRQQLDNKDKLKQIDVFLVDSLILFALEGTDPDLDKLRSRAEIEEVISAKLNFDPQVLGQLINKQLAALSKKPRRIRHHRKKDSYCLPYDTRLEMEEKNLRDSELHDTFRDQARDQLGKQLRSLGVTVKKPTELLECAFNTIFYQQGLEFSDFILKGENKDAVEKSLEEIVSQVVENSSVVPKNREAVKSALMITIRDIVYNGTAEQKRFLEKLSSTYLMMFLLQCDPKLGTFFSSMAGKLTVYVCTSILIPAMSEIYLEPQNKRHWNLLKGAFDMGVTLVVNDTILNELCGHFQMITKRFRDVYQRNEAIYISSEETTLYIDEILIRAYFYARIRGQVSSFEQFLDNFVTPDLKLGKEELMAWLKEEFGITYCSDESLNVTIDAEDRTKLVNELSKHKHSDAQAKNDAHLILLIYALRKRNNEAGNGGVFGYKTWWLSKDTITMRIANKVFANRYEVSCYMRPDFLYNYISLAPSLPQIKKTFGNLFPTLLGVNLSHHLPENVVTCVHNCLQEHNSKNTGRIIAIITRLTHQLRTDAKCRNRTFVKHFLEDELGKLEER